MENYKKHIKFKVSKLVRSKTLENMRNDGLNPKIEELEQYLYYYHIKVKLVESSRNLLQAKDNESLLQLLSKCLDIFYLFLNINFFSFADVIDQMNKKQKERGSICNQFLSYLEMDKIHPLYEKYVKAGYSTISKEDYDKEKSSKNFFFNKPKNSENISNTSDSDKVIFKIFKLVRRKTLEQMIENNIKGDIRALPRYKYPHQVKLKIIEEAREVLKAKNKKNLLEEIADFFEAFNLLLELNSLSISTVTNEMLKIQQAKGTIGNYFLSEVDIPLDHKSYNLYIENKYKIITSTIPTT